MWAVSSSPLYDSSEITRHVKSEDICTSQQFTLKLILKPTWRDKRLCNITPASLFNKIFILNSVSLPKSSKCWRMNGNELILHPVPIDNNNYIVAAQQILEFSWSGVFHSTEPLILAVVTVSVSAVTNRDKLAGLICTWAALWLHEYILPSLQIL